jgi:hypothetical protein
MIKNFLDPRFSKQHSVARLVNVSILILLFIVIQMILPTRQANAASATSFNAGNIISDSIFTNNKSMDVNQIQNFLNSKVPNCDTNGTQRSEFGSGTRAQWAATRGNYPPFTCLKDYKENGIGAAQIIHNVSQQYQINPQVLIVLLQKEQGLVTDTWPMPNQYRSATGYGCPDTAPCNVQYYGLTNQISWSAKMFHSIMIQSPNWYTPYTVGNNNIKWNPSNSCGSGSVVIKNLATAALYSYTPYQPNQAALNAGYGTGDSCSAYGNRNFYLYFNDWFGSTYSPEPIGASIFNQRTTGKVYLVTNGIRYYVPGWDMMVNYGLDKFGIVTVEDSSINNLTDGGTLSNLVWDSSGVYLVNNGTRHHVSIDMCTAWGLDCLNGSVVKGIGTLFQTGGLGQGSELTEVMSYEGVVYKMSNGLRQPIADSQSMIDLGIANKTIIGSSKINSEKPLGGLLITTPGVITYASTMYYYDGSRYFKILSPTQYHDWNMSKVRQISPQTSSYNTIPPSSTPLSSWIKNGSDYYVIDNEKRIKIPSDMTSIWQSDKYSDITSQPNQLFTSLKQDTLMRAIQVNGVIYVIEGNTKRFVPTYPDYTGLNLNQNTTTDLSSDKASIITEGPNIFANGKIISIQDGSGKAYVVNNNKLTYILGSDVFSAYGFDYGAVNDALPSITNSYPIDSKVLDNTIDQNNVYLMVKGSIRKISIDEAQSRGIQTSLLTPINSTLLKNASTKSMSPLINDDDTGKVYFASNGTLKYVSTYSTYSTLERAYGVTHVNTNTVNLFNVSGTMN